jgi:hypothetical protein
MDRGVKSETVRHLRTLLLADHIHIPSQTISAMRIQTQTLCVKTHQPDGRKEHAPPPNAGIKGAWHAYGHKTVGGFAGECCRERG